MTNLGLAEGEAFAFSEHTPVEPAGRMSLLDRFFRAVFVALAVGLAWGIRGDFGHEVGAMYPGAILGLAFAYVSGQRSLFRWMPILGALSGLLIATGGNMSYGVLHGYGKADTFVNYTYGLFTLFLQGGAWGVFACAAIGLLMERERLTAFEWVGAIATVLLAGHVFYWIVVGIFGFDINPPRSNAAIGYTGGVIGLFLWLAFNRRKSGLRGAILGYVGFGLGMCLGRIFDNFANAAQYGQLVTLADGTVENLRNGLWLQLTDPERLRELWAAGEVGQWFGVNSWNIMEDSVGLIGGFVFTFGMLGRSFPDPPEGQNVRLLSVYGIFYTLGLIPLLHRMVSVDVEGKMEGWINTLRTWGYADPELLARFLGPTLTLLVYIGFVGAVLWLMIHFFEGYQLGWFPVMFLSLLMILFENVAAPDIYSWRPFVPDSNPPQFSMHFVFWMLYLGMVAYVVVQSLRGGPTPATGREHIAERSHVGRWALVGLAGFALAVAAAGYLNGPATMTSGNTRWPDWNWREGEFPREQYEQMFGE